MLVALHSLPDVVVYPDLVTDFCYLKSSGRNDDPLPLFSRPVQPLLVCNRRNLTEPEIRIMLG